MSSRDDDGVPGGRTAWWRRGWLMALAVAAVVVATVGGVQLVADSGGGAADSGGEAAAVGSREAAGAAVPTAAGAVSAAVELFAEEDAPEVQRESAGDLAAAWPLADCVAAAGSAAAADAAAATDAGRVDFLTGTERGPEYARDLAVGWYVDAAAARAAYDGLLAQLQTCADGRGARLVSEPASVADVASRVTTWQPGEGGAAEQSTYALATVGAVVVLAGDHAATYLTGDAAPSAFEGTAGQAERLLAEACRVDPARC